MECIFFNKQNLERRNPIYNTADALTYKYIRNARKELIDNPTAAERILWEYLKCRNTGYKIRRQHVIDKYIVDFVCLSHRLVIEIDGLIHLHQKEQDNLRTISLNEKGFKLIRFTNEEVYENASLIALKIKEVLDRLNPTDLP